MRCHLFPDFSSSAVILQTLKTLSPLRLYKHTIYYTIQYSNHRKVTLKVSCMCVIFHQWVTAGQSCTCAVNPCHYSTHWSNLVQRLRKHDVSRTLLDCPFDPIDYPFDSIAWNCQENGWNCLNFICLLWCFNKQFQSFGWAPHACVGITLVTLLVFHTLVYFLLTFLS